MKKVLITLLMALAFAAAKTQQNGYISVATSTSQNAMPFGKFKDLFTETFHPGVEFGYGKIINSKIKHVWFVELKFGYFFHRFVQHSIPLYLNFGYRYHINSHFSAETSLGAGYMHSIPATAKLKLDENGDYKNNKGIGRMQAMANYAIGIGYIPKPNVKKPVRIFMQYQQRLQTPFVKSYVPLLPYTNFSIGFSKPIAH